MEINEEAHTTDGRTCRFRYKAIDCCIIASIGRHRGLILREIVDRVRNDYGHIERRSILRRIQKLAAIDRIFIYKSPRYPQRLYLSHLSPLKSDPEMPLILDEQIGDALSGLDHH